MKKKFFLVVFLFIFVACTGNTAIPETLSNESQIATIVAATLSALPSPTSIPSLTPTETLTPTNTPQPYYSYQNSEFGFECLYPLDVTYTDWGGGYEGFLLFYISFNRPSYKSRGEAPEVSFAIYGNPDKLPLKEWVAAHTARSDWKENPYLNKYDKTSEIKELSIDGHSAIIFIADSAFTSDDPTLLIANDQQIIEISEFAWGPFPMRDVFLTVASSLKFSQSMDALTIDNEVKETLDSALNSLSQ